MKNKIEYNFNMHIFLIKKKRGSAGYSTFVSTFQYRRSVTEVEEISLWCNIWLSVIFAIYKFIWSSYEAE